MRLINKITSYEYLRNCFLGTNYKDKSKTYVSEEYDYINSPCVKKPSKVDYNFIDFNTPCCLEKVYILHCSCCGEKTNIKDIQIRNNIITCPHCNESTHLSQLMSFSPISSNSSVEIMMHNINNGTELSVNVPTIINLGENSFYCNHCHKTRPLNSDEFSHRDNKLICNCGAEYTFEECKITRCQDILASGEIYFDSNKISISIISKRFDINRHGNYYCQNGNTRATMNLETGYSYVTNKGSYYTEFNRIYGYRDNHNKKAPVMFNATYSSVFNHLDLLASAKVRNLYRKYKEFPNLITFINKHSYKLTIEIKCAYKKQIDEYMTNYYNNKYSYKIPSLGESINYNYRNLFFDDFVLKNRFINLDHKNISAVKRFLCEVKYDNFKIKYSSMSRESNCPIIDCITKTLLISKKLRKTMINDFYNIVANDNYNSSTINTLFNFVNLAKDFKKKESVNKLYSNIMSHNSLSDYHRFFNTDLKIWRLYRDEDYISNLKYNELINKFNLMQDSLRLLNNIQKVYGDNFNIDFKNEKQYHDDLMTVYNSKAFIEARELLKQQRLDELFVIEDKCLELTNNDIEIAKTERQLCDIGNEMCICVGGYGNDVRERDTRIAYIKDENKYKVCLELKSIKDNKKKDSYKYELRQAKLTRNRLVGTNEKYYKIVFDWCEENNIAIVTGDMKKRFEQED